MALSVTSQKKKPAPRKNPEGLIDEALVRDVAPAVAVGFAHAHLEANFDKFDWWQKMSTAKRLLLLVVGGVYFRRQGKTALSFALFGMAGTYVQKYLTERKLKNATGAGAGAPAAAPPPQTMVPAGQQTMVTQEMQAVAGMHPMGALTNYASYDQAPAPFDPSSLMLPGNNSYEFALG